MVVSLNKGPQYTPTYRPYAGDPKRPPLILGNPNIDEEDLLLKHSPQRRAVIECASKKAEPSTSSKPGTT